MARYESQRKHFPIAHIHAHEVWQMTRDVRDTDNENRRRDRITADFMAMELVTITPLIRQGWCGAVVIASTPITEGAPPILRSAQGCATFAQPGGLNTGLRFKRGTSRHSFFFLL